jgi:hypothetical protein
VDDKRFDALTQRLASIRLTRGSALRGMVASGLTLVGVTTVADEASAGKKKKYCDCPDDTADCTDAKKSKKGRKRYLSSHPCSYKGTCRGTGSRNPCEDAGTTITVLDTTLLGVDCEISGDECGDPGETGLSCVVDICLPIAVGDICSPGSGEAECAFGSCTGAVCICDVASVCENETTGEVRCCVAAADCIEGFCVLPLSSLE